MTYQITKAFTKISLGFEKLTNLLHRTMAQEFLE